MGAALFNLRGSSRKGDQCEKGFISCNAYCTMWKHICNGQGWTSWNIAEN